VRTAGRASLVLAVLVALVLARPAPAPADIYYVYDDLGRLIAVTDPAAGTARYLYDAVGNLVSVVRQPASAVSIIEFRPKRGPVGTTVTIQGTGFGATPGANTVTVNGTAATVTATSPYELTVTVPAGATTGPIAVTAPGGSATSSTAFQVTATDGTPAITGFTPNVGTPGATFTISGTDFDPTPTSNKLAFPPAGLAALVGSATATSLGVTVPATARSGRLTLSTPGGTVQSAIDFFVPPYPPPYPNLQYSADQVGFTGRIAVGGSSLAGSLTTSKIALVVFDGVAGQRLGFGVTNNTLGYGGMYVFRPDGGMQASGNLDATVKTLNVPTLPVTGTYQFVLVPSAGHSGTFTLTLSEQVVGAIVVDGSSVGTTSSRPGQQTFLSFPGTAGQRLNVGATAVTYTTSTVAVLKPDGSTLVSGTAGPNGLGLATPPLPAAGTYTIQVNPALATTGSMTVTLSTEIAGSIAVGGSSVPLSITRAGQRARLTFDATAGQRLSLGVTSSSFPPWPKITIFKPGGGIEGILDSNSSAGAALDVGPLGSTGTYEIFFEPWLATTGGVTLWLSEEVAATITPGGDPLPISIARPGQRARISFAGTSGQQVSFRLTGVTLSGVFASLFTPAGSQLGGMEWLTGTTSFFDTKTLTSTGTHAFLLDPNLASTGSLTVTGYLAPDVTGTLTINGAALPVNLATPGQNAVLSVTAPAGTALTARITNNTITGCTTLSLRESSGVLQSSTSVCGASGSVTRTMTTTGTHTVIVNPAGANTGTADASVTSP